MYSYGRVRKENKDDNDTANLLSSSPQASKDRGADTDDLFMTIDKVREFDSHGAGLYNQIHHGGNSVEALSSQGHSSTTVNAINQ